FFFQAEDGIRDYKVTGVQTCALPISDPHCGCKISSFINFMLGIAKLNFGELDVISVHRGRRPEQSFVHLGAKAHLPGADGIGGRSEERRVGKEGRSRGARDGGKKKRK